MHDCSYSTKEVLRYHKYITCLKSNNKTVYDFKSYEKSTIVEPPKKDYYPYIGVCVSHPDHGEGYVIDIYSAEALKVRFGKDEFVFKKDKLKFHDEMYTYMRLLLYPKTVIYKGEKHKAIDYHDGKILLDNNETVQYFSKDIALVNEVDLIKPKDNQTISKPKDTNSSNSIELNGYKIGMKVIYNYSEYEISKINLQEKTLGLKRKNITHLVTVKVNDPRLCQKGQIKMYSGRK